MTNLRPIPLASMLVVGLLAACAGGSSGGGKTMAPPVVPQAQVTAAAAEGLPAVDTAAAQALLSADQMLQTVSFPDTGTTTVSGKIDGYRSAAYAVPARAGQTLTVTMTTPSTSASFNVRDVRDQSGQAVHRGDVDGRTATVAVPADTTYLIDPYLVRAVARRGSTADYSLTISRK